MIGIRLDLRQTQQLVMTPQLQQAIKLLQMSNLELAEFVEQAAEANPLIAIERAEIAEADHPAAAPAEADPIATDLRVTPDGDHALAGETFDTGAENLHDGEAVAAFTASSRQTGAGHDSLGGGADLPDFESRLPARPTLLDHLREQLGRARADGNLALIARYLIEELDESGYLRADPAEIAGRLSVPPAEVGAALALLQSCEPTGVGARSLAECLGLQLAERGRLDAAMRALLDNLDLLARGEWRRLRALCRVDDAGLSAMIHDLRRLDPRPCAGFDAAEPEALVPDILMRRTGWGGWELELNPDTLPRVLIDRAYVASIGPVPDGETRRWLAEAQASAGWLVHSLDQRARTILRITSEIVRQQQRFLDEGITGLRPLTLRAVADAVGMHESTASRVTSNKYIATERGIFALKFFFTNAVGGGGRDGAGDVAAESVRHRIRAMVDAEDAHDVLSDDAIVAQLAAEGVEVARRTVAKYRKALNIPSSVDRRRLNAMGRARAGA
ncbi:MAG TPA: RNA polymerase factor sigma-54 [Paracoccaceae bacterium]|nr:RNA polymerase factor sigma-54 [Paracoccaceae bacterium]